MSKESLSISRRPSWLKVKIPGGEAFSEVKKLVENNCLHTVCQSARCPNISECWSRHTATFMILGDVCTRSCSFCAVSTGTPLSLDPGEPKHVAEAIAKLNLNYAVITSVTRDDLADGGASVFASVVNQIRRLRPQCKIELLIPDFNGLQSALQTILNASPDVLNHNVETVPRLYPEVRPQADYQRSMSVLARAKKSGTRTKSGMMVGIGETFDEVLEVMKDLRQVRCDILTIGQYLQPTKKHQNIARFVHPDEFAEFTSIGRKMGFRHVESGPLVRSSYHADEQAALK